MKKSRYNRIITTWLLFVTRLLTKCGPLSLLFLSEVALAASLPGLPILDITTNDNGGQSYTLTIEILLLMTLFSFLPAMLLMMTCFTRIIIVFAILRQAIGLQQSPSNQVMIGMALFLSLFVMTPVFEQVNIRAVQPYINEEISNQMALKRGLEPFHQFMRQQTRKTDIELFMRISGKGPFQSPEDIPMTVLIPSFITSELKTAFQIGFLLFIPFLIIDMVVASVLMAMGMMMLSPMIVSLPFKIMLFVFVDGWAMVIGTLASSFGL